MKSLLLLLFISTIGCFLNPILGQKQSDRKAYTPDKVVRFLDKDQDGKICKEEATLAKRLIRNFEYIDKDQDGFLTLTELKNTNRSTTYTYLENDGIYMYYETDAHQTYRKLLPEIFEMPDRLLVYTFISDFYKMKGDTEPYKEASIFLLGNYKGVLGWHCVYMPVTSGHAMLMSILRLGLPKTMGKIDFTRSATVYSAHLIDKDHNTMTLSIDTQGYSLKEKETAALKELSLIPKMNILQGKVIQMGKKGNGKAAKTSVFDIAKAMPHRLQLKMGKGSLKCNLGTETGQNNLISPLNLYPTKIIGTYYLQNSIPFKLTGNTF